MSEQNITNSIIDYLNQLPMSDAYETTNTGRIRNRRIVAKSKRKGISDISWTYYGISIKLETKVKGRIKSEDGKQSKDQEDFQEDTEAAGGMYFLVRSVDDVIKIIDDLNKEPWFITYRSCRFYNQKQLKQHI